MRIPLDDEMPRRLREEEIIDEGVTLGCQNSWSITSSR